MGQQNKNKKTTLQVIKEVWPKLLIFTVMLLITVFQKSPEKMKSMGQSDEKVQEQIKSGLYETTQFEYGPFRQKAIENLLFAAILIVIYLFIKRKNDLAEEAEEQQAEIEEEDELYPGVKTFKKWQLQREETEKQKQKQESTFWEKFKKNKAKKE